MSLVDEIEETTGVPLSELNRQEISRLMENNNEIETEIREAIDFIGKVDGEKKKELVIIFFRELRRLIPLRPLIRAKISEKKWKRWLKEQRQSLKYLYDMGYFKFIFRYFTQEEFEEALKCVIERFEKRVCDNPFVLLRPTTNESFRWVFRLTEKEWRNVPVCDNIKKLREYVNNHPRVKNIVLLDDASYSGQQLIAWIKAIDSGGIPLKRERFKLNILIPFFGARSLEKMKDIKRKYNVRLFYKEGIKETSEILKEIEKMEAARGAPAGIKHVEDFKEYLISRKIKRSSACFFFDHKVADDIGLSKLLLEVKRDLIYFLLLPPYREGYLAEWAIPKILQNQ